MDRAERRLLMRIVRKAGDFATAMRFYAVALLGRGMSSPKIAEILAIAVSTVVRAGHAYVAEGVAGLYATAGLKGDHLVAPHGAHPVADPGVPSAAGRAEHAGRWAADPAW
jgi:hypothetical protein